jgi:hypothetical protein
MNLISNQTATVTRNSAERRGTEAFLATASFNPTSPALKVSFGQATFDAEGTEGPNRFFSRQIHWPGGAESGVTLGRGYDMGNRTGSQIRYELTQAGVPENEATFFARAAGLKGRSAREFIEDNREHAPLITLTAQKRLFEQVLVPYYVADIKRIFSRPDVIGKYGEASWEGLSNATKEVLFDLRYRGDYTPATRGVLQPLLVENDSKGVADFIRERSYWAERGVPRERIERRIAIVYSE